MKSRGVVGPDMPSDPERTPDKSASPPPGGPPPPSLHGPSHEPNTATLLHILRLLNKAADDYEEVEEQGLEEAEIVLDCNGFWAVREAGAQPTLLLRLLVDNGMVDRMLGEHYSWVRQRQVKDMYRITEPGKEHLMKTLGEAGRVE